MKDIFASFDSRIPEGFFSQVCFNKFKIEIFFWSKVVKEVVLFLSETERTAPRLENI